MNQRKQIDSASLYDFMSYICTKHWQRTARMYYVSHASE